MDNQNEDLTLQQRLLDSEKMVERLHLALREASHRCLNEWQMLAALVDIERLQHRDTVPVDSLMRLHTHIRTLAAIHNMLAWRPPLSENSDGVSVKEVLDGLLTLLQVTYSDYDLLFDVEEALLSRHSCISLALICSELVCNAVKHGTSSTQVLFHIHENDGCLLVRDDGPGFPEGFDHRVSARMGLEIVESLCRHDLRGNMRCENYPGGGQVMVTFPVWPRDSLNDLPVLGQTYERDLCLM